MKFHSFIFSSLFFLAASLSAKAQEVSPYLVGTNLWYTNPSTTVWNLTQQCGVQTIRIGGAEYDQNMPSNQTILSWVKQIQAIGAEPIVQVSEYQSAAVAASLVTYLNVTNKGVIPPKFWCIGNEPWLQANKPSTSTFAAVVEGYYKPISAAMKLADSTIQIYGPDECDYMDYYTDLFGGKNDISGKIPGHTYYYCDGLSWHRYPQGSGDPATEGASDMFTRIKQAKAKVDEVNTLHNRTGSEALQWGIGEYNSKGGAEVHTWGNGQMFGAVLGWCIEYGATYATSWSMFESGGSRTGADFSYIDGNMKPRASYWHMQFVAEYFKGSYVKGTSSSSDILVFGAQTNDQLSVMIMNRGYGNPKEYTLFLNDTATSTASVTLKVNAARDSSYSDVIGIRTTQVLIFRGDSIIKINYNSDDFDKQVPPTVSKVTISTQLPNSPTGMVATPTSYKSVSLAWTDNADNENGFMIERLIGGVFKSIAIAGTDVKSYTESGLSAETTYVYRVVAYNSLGKSAYSENDTVTTLETPAPKAYKGPHYIPGKIEAEDFDVNDEGISYHDADTDNKGGKYRTTSGVDIETSTDTGGGYNIAYVASGEWLIYLIDSVKPGIYDITIRSASNATTTKRIDVYIDNVKVGQVVPNYTAGWQVWETLTIKNVEIKDAQPKLMKLLFTGVDFNVNWIEFATPISSAKQEIELNNGMKAYFDINNQSIEIQINHTMEQASIKVFNSLGQLFYSKNKNSFTNETIPVSNWPTGIYFVTASNSKERFTHKIRIN
jgi:hypothetical protein